MSDPMDIYSKPLKTKATKLGKLFWLKKRANPDKPGRELVVNFDERIPLVEGFKIRYCYLVKYLKQNNAAGNHYHIRKQEIFVPVVGKIEVILEDTKSKARESVVIDADATQAFYINPKVAHTAISRSKNAILLVLATSANTDEDEFEYKLTGDQNEK